MFTESIIINFLVSCHKKYTIKLMTTFYVSLAICMIIIYLVTPNPEILFNSKKIN